MYKAVKLLAAGLKTVFMNAFTAYKPVYPQLTTRIVSTKASEEYGRLGIAPELSEWIDERQAKGLKENGFTLKNKDYEATIAVDRNSFKDDQYGQINIRVAGMGTVAARGYDKILAKMIESNPICYDGQNFFDTDHMESGTAQANVQTSKALTAENAIIALTAMSAIQDENQEPFGTVASHVLVPNALKYTAKIIFDPTIVGVSTDPAKVVLKGEVEVIVLPQLTSAVTWYLLDLNQGVKPFIFQDRESLHFDSMDTDSDYEAFMRKVYYYGASARFAFGVGDWKTAYKLVG